MRLVQKICILTCHAKSLANRFFPISFNKYNSTYMQDCIIDTCVYSYKLAGLASLNIKEAQFAESITVLV